MGWTDRTKCVAWGILALVCLAARGGPATAMQSDSDSDGQGVTEATAVEEETAGEPGCFPTCRTGYLCYEGKCIEACNPPCPEGERCTADGECVLRQPAFPTSPPVVETKPATETEPAPLVTPAIADGEEEEADGEGEEEPPPLLKGMLGAGAMGSVCVSSYGCTVADGEWGLGGTISGGYLVLPWMSVDLQLNLTSLFLEKKFDSQKTKPEGVLFSMVAGVTFLPLKRSHPVEPVFGVHLGYGLQRSSWDDENDSTIKAATHGLALQYTLGVDFNFSRRLTMGLHIVVREPIYTKSCVDTSASDFVDPTTGSTGGAAESYCSPFDGNRDQFFFDPVIDLRLYF